MKPGLRVALVPDAAQSRTAGAKRKAGAARIGMFSLSFREQIQSPENASIARFGGLGCYRSGSGKRWLATGERGGCETGCWAAVMQGVPDEMLRVLQAARETGLRAALMPDAAQSRTAGATRKASAARMRAFPLFFREQIQGPKNASIARFDGLCCY